MTTTTQKRRKTRKFNTRKSKTRKHVKQIHTGLYPPIKPFATKQIKVSDLHTVSYSLYGNPNGKPALFVHGGPGAGAAPFTARFFNPKAYFIITVDQRGCGKSLPYAELRENTSQDLISDFEKIRETLGIKKWMVFGGSWGSTLSLAYTIAHPERVTELIIRGIFFGTRHELEWSNKPNGAARFNLEGWEMYNSVIPEKDRGDLIKAYGKCFRGEYGNKKREEGICNWWSWENSLSQLDPIPLNKIQASFKKDKRAKANALIEQHYFSHDCFFEPGYFLKKSNLDRIRHIPTVIVQGRYDLECPFETAWKLHKALPKAKFCPTIAGHTATDPENAKYLVAATDSFAHNKSHLKNVQKGGVALDPDFIDNNDQNEKAPE